MDHNRIDENKMLDDLDYRQNIIKHISSGIGGSTVMVEQIRDFIRKNNMCEYDYVRSYELYFCDGSRKGEKQTIYERIKDKDVRDYFYGRKSLGELLLKNPGIFMGILTVWSTYKRVGTIDRCMLSPNETDCKLMIERYCEHLQEQKE